MPLRMFGALAALLILAQPAAAWAGPAPRLCASLQQEPQKGADQKSDHAKDDRRGPFKWWINDNSRAELGISNEQSAAIEDIWQASLPKLRASRRQLDELESVLSQMIRDAAEESLVAAQIDRVESVRSEMNKGRTLMLYRMNRVLSADQRQKLKAMHDRWEASRRRSGS